MSRQQWADLIGLMQAGLRWGGGPLGVVAEDVDRYYRRWLGHFDSRRKYKYHRIHCTACRREDEPL